SPAETQRTLDRARLAGRDRGRGRDRVRLAPDALVPVLLGLGPLEDKGDCRLLGHGSVAPARLDREGVAFAKHGRWRPFLLDAERALQAEEHLVLPGVRVPGKRPLHADDL